MAAFLKWTRRGIALWLLCSGCAPATEPPPRIPTPVEVKSATAAEQCATEICQLIAKRLELMPGVARAKWNRQLPITDEKREQALLRKLTADGAAGGLPADVVTEFFQAQITAAKLIQEHAFEEWKGTQQTQFENPPDLEQEVRPQIDQLNQLMLKALAKCQAQRPENAWNSAVEGAQKSVFSGTKWPKVVLETAVMPLLSK